MIAEFDGWTQDQIHCYMRLEGAQWLDEWEKYCEYFSDRMSEGGNLEEELQYVANWMGSVFSDLHRDPPADVRGFKVSIGPSSVATAPTHYIWIDQPINGCWYLWRLDYDERTSLFLVNT